MQTVLGVFDTNEQAEHAREALLDAGFDDSAVRLQSHSGVLEGEGVGEGNDASGSRSVREEREEPGFAASVSRFFSGLFGNDAEHAGNYSEAVRRGGTVVAVTVDESRMETARATLAAAGAVDIDKRTESWRQEGYAGFDSSAQPYDAAQVQAERSRLQAGQAQTNQTQTNQAQTSQDTVMPVVREDLEVGKREVDLGAVRVFSHTEVRPVQEDIQLREERAEIERRPVDRPATAADLKAFEGGSVEIHETAERAVVNKTARVVEEVTVGTHASTHTETISEQLRNTVVDVEKTGADSMDASAAMPDYRSHYQSHLAAMGGRYEDYEPAYRYGSALRSDARYTNRSWEQIEPEAQRDWAGRHPGSTWEKVKQAVRHGWESMTGRR